MAHTFTANTISTAPTRRTRRIFMHARATLTAVLLIALMVPQWAAADASSSRQAQLQAELQTVEREMLQNQVLIKNTQQQRQSLERDISIINGQIKQAQLGIEARTVAIKQLGSQIQDKESLISILNDRLDRQKQSLAELLRQTQRIDDFSLAEVLLSQKTFSSFFTDVQSFRSVKGALNDSLDALSAIKAENEQQKQSLEDKQLQEARLKQAQVIERQNIVANQQQKQEILTVTKGKEQNYKTLLASQQKTAAQLKSELFKLLGGGGAIPFPTAVKYAQVAANLTGVPASLVLAILEQESAYGSNIGNCKAGDMFQGKAVMNPKRDQPAFLAIAAQLGFNPDTQVVSCPLTRANGTRIGWGGAMGASQFIPSTWAIYGGFVKGAGGTYTYDPTQDAIRTLLGKSTPGNPFNNQDAFLATALLLRDNGADGTYTNDRLAALRYYAGWGGASNPENAFYGDDVMQRQARLQTEIQTLQGG